MDGYMDVDLDGIFENTPFSLEGQIADETSGHLASWFFSPSPGRSKFLQMAFDVSQLFIFWIYLYAYKNSSIPYTMQLTPYLPHLSTHKSHGLQKILMLTCSLSLSFTVVGVFQVQDTWRIILVSKWFTTMTSKFPNCGCSTSKWPKWLGYTWWLLTTYYLGCVAKFGFLFVPFFHLGYLFHWRLNNWQ